MDIAQIVPYVKEFKETAEKGLADIKRDQGNIKEKQDEISAAQGDLRVRVQDLEQHSVRGSKGGGISIATSFDVAKIAGADTFAKFRSGAVRSTDRYDLGLGVKALVNFSNDGSSNNNAFPTFADRSSEIHYVGGLREFSLLDLLPAIPVISNRYEFAQMMFTGGAAAQADEGDEKAEAEFDGDLAVASIATIAVHTTASMQLLEDDARMGAFLNRIMSHNVLDKLERSLITGSGVNGNIEGLYTQAPYITVLPSSENNAADQIGDAKQQMEAAGYSPNVVIMNPEDWFLLNVIRENGNTGAYIFGNPAEPRPKVLWSLPVVTSPSIPAGRALIGDTRKTNLLDRMQPTVYMTRDYKDYATRNLVLILVELRAGLALYDQAAFRKIDLAHASV